MNDLIENIKKLHTTEMGVGRIRKNLSIETEDVVQWCKMKILQTSTSIEKRGKNWYAAVGDFVIWIRQNKAIYEAMKLFIVSISQKSMYNNPYLLRKSAISHVKMMKLQSKRGVELKWIIRSNF